MSDVFKILSILESKKIRFCLQSQVNFYNLTVEDRKGKMHYVNGASIEVIDKGLKILWGDLVEPPAQKLGMGLNFDPRGTR